MTDFAPVDLWPCRFLCDVSTSSPYVTGMAVRFATDVLWALTGRQFGLTSVTLRPSRWCTRDTPFPDAWMAMPGAQAPPLGATSYGGGWYGFGVTVGDCTNQTEAHLPAPIKSITQVKVDGVVLDPSAYRVDDNRKLIRTDGSTWPLFNDLRYDDTKVGTWSVTAQFGVSVPAGAEWPVGELACEYMRGVNGEDCRLPRNILSIARQGVTIQLPSITDQFKNKLTGMPLADTFIQTWNPGRLNARSRTYSVDQIGPRRVGT